MIIKHIALYMLKDRVRCGVPHLTSPFICKEGTGQAGMLAISNWRHLWFYGLVKIFRKNEKKDCNIGAVLVK